MSQINITIYNIMSMYMYVGRYQYEQYSITN